MTLLRVKLNDDSIILNLETANIVKILRYQACAEIHVLYGRYAVYITTSHTDAWALLQKLQQQSPKEPQEPQQVHELLADSCDVRYLDT